MEAKAAEIDRQQRELQTVRVSKYEHFFVRQSIISVVYHRPFMLCITLYVVYHPLGCVSL